MPKVNCKICNKSFYTKPFSLKMGWGLFCSKECHYLFMKKGHEIKCEICNKTVYKSIAQLKKSKSGKFFCSKSCQTVWRNQQYVGSNHKLWKGGLGVNYRKLLTKENKKIFCRLCKERDKRILAVHHIDKNRTNNKINNLVWLCHNCHYLVHCDNLEKQQLSK
jgi:hypothetical protein